MNNKEILEKYEKRLGSKGNTKNLYLRYAGDFLNYANGNFDRETIDKYLDHLRTKKTMKKYSDGSKNFVFRVIRTLFSRNDIEWPFRRGESPQIREDNVTAPALNPKTVIRMIEAVKGNGQPDERAFLALSSTYGLRRVEMVELMQKDIRFKDRTIHIATAKHGRERTHIIPEQIIPHLKCYDFDTTVSEFALFTLWYRLEHSIGLQHPERANWHSIRRALNHMLARELTDVTVKSFLRHKQRTSSDMTYRYSAVKFVGEEEETVELAASLFQVDNDVFKIHPFIKYWGD